MKTAAQIQGLVLSGATVQEVGEVLGLEPEEIGRTLSLAATTKEELRGIGQLNNLRRQGYLWARWRLDK